MGVGCYAVCWNNYTLTGPRFHFSICSLALIIFCLFVFKLAFLINTETESCCHISIYIRIDFCYVAQASFKLLILLPHLVWGLYLYTTMPDQMRLFISFFFSISLSRLLHVYHELIICSFYWSNDILLYNCTAYCLSLSVNIDSSLALFGCNQ